MRAALKKVAGEVPFSREAIMKMILGDSLSFCRQPGQL